MKTQGGKLEASVKYSHEQRDGGCSIEVYLHHRSVKITMNNAKYYNSVILKNVKTSQLLMLFRKQGCHRVLVSLFSWPGQLLSLNPCQRPKILARMLFWGILSLTVVILEITAYLIRDCDYWGKQTNA